MTTVSLLFVKVPTGQHSPVFVQGHPVRPAVSWYRSLDARSALTWAFVGTFLSLIAKANLLR